MNLLQLYRFPAVVFICLLALLITAIVSVVNSTTVILNNHSVLYKTSSGGRWGAFSHDQEILDKKSGKHYIKTYRTFCISNLFVSPQDAIKADRIYLTIPLNEINKRSDIKYYALSAHPLSAITLFFHLISHIISNYTYLVFVLVLILALFKKELDKDYAYHSALHKRMINAACLVVISMFVLFAIY